MPRMTSPARVRRCLAVSGAAILSALWTSGAWATPQEVTNVRVEKGTEADSPECIIWDIKDSCTFHVYRGDLSTIASGYGSCLVGNVPDGRAEIPEDPLPGEAFFYLVTEIDPTGEGTAGFDSDGNERLLTSECVPVRRNFAAVPDGDPGDGVEDGQYPLRNASLLSRSSSRELSGVYLHSGEFTLSATDLVIPGRGIDWSFTRTYRSQMNYDGPFGHNWDSNVNARLVPLGTDVLFFDGAGRQEQFFRVDSTRFASPPGRYAVLRENPDGSFVLREPDGTLHEFHGFDGSNVQGTLEAIEDRNGNRITFQYDFQGLLTGVTDTLGRAVGFTYDDAGRLTDVTDFAGRTCRLGYDAAGDLVSARSPTVTGTPTGNDFPTGKTTRYAYSAGSADARLNHCLESVTWPNQNPAGPPAMSVSYFGSSDPPFDQGRVSSWTVGDGVTAGGTLSFAYQSLSSGGDPADLTLPRRQTDVIDRNGNLTRYLHNHPGNLISRTDFTNREVRPGEGDYTTERDYNADGEVVELRLPEGNRVQYVYDAPGADRYREGNLLELRRIADPVASGGRGDGHGAEASDIVYGYTYEPVYNQWATVIEPRGNEPAFVPQNGGAWSSTRYTTSRTFDYEEGDPVANGIDSLATRFEIDLTAARSNLGDRNGDGRTDQAAGNSVRTDSPSVLLDSASNQAGIEGDLSQEIATRLLWNDLGQLTAVIDAESNRHELSYHAEEDPDGDGTATPTPPDGRILDTVTGGYLASRLIDSVAGADRNNKTDPSPTAILETFTYDDVGNRTHVVNGRGVLTRSVFNELNQLVELRRAAATADTAGPDGDPATGRGESGLTPFGFRVRYEYDANDNVTAVRTEDRDQDRAVGSFVDVSHGFDLLDRRVSQTQEATTTKSLVTLFEYDANENLTAIVRPEGNRHEWSYDERDLLFRSTRGAAGPRGGAPAIRTYHYDGNHNEIRFEDARGNEVDHRHDGFDRLTQVVDQVGNSAELFYDPAGHRVRELARGPVGGPTPTDRLGLSNVDLADVAYRYDELGRLFRIDHGLFVPAGLIPGRPAVLLEGPLVPGDGFVNQAIEYDRLSRPTFALRDSGATWRYDYDGAGRRILTTEPDGSTAESFYDASDNRIESVETELSSSSTVPAELFLATSFYDALNRRSQVVDNVGQTWGYLYDSLDALELISDPNGPSGPAINRRSPAHALTTVTTNLHGNVTRYDYDGAGRLLARESVLTASGLGDGTPAPPPITGDPDNPDGLLRLTTQWDDNSLRSAVVDDKGSTTAYAYDNLNRLVTRTMDDGTVHGFSYDGEDNLTSETDANGSTFSHTYDAANRLTQTSVLPATGLEGTTLQDREYDGLGRITRAVDHNDPASPSDDAEVVSIYDSLGRVLEEQQTLLLVGGQKLVDYHWQAEGRITDLIYPSGRQIQYGYDLVDRLVTVGDVARTETAAFDWFGTGGRWHTRSYGNGVRATMLDDAGVADVGFDGVRRITRLRHLDVNDLVLAGFEHGYDRASNRLHELRLHDQDVASGGVRGELWSFDSADRLTGFQEGPLDPSTLALIGPASDSQSWQLDGVDNWVTMTRNGVDYGFTPSNNNEYDENQTGGGRTDDGLPDDTYDDRATPTADGRNQSHDRNGSTTDEGQYSVVYDAWNRPVRIVRNADGLTVLENKFDAYGRRVWKQVSNSGALDETRRYLYGPVTPTASPAAAFSWAKDKIKAAVDWTVDKVGKATEWPFD